MAWVLTIFGRPFLQAGGTGDLRAFQNASLKALVLIGCASLLILTTPFLAGYAAMNLVGNSTSYKGIQEVKEEGRE